jgi:hypothetical protein
MKNITLVELQVVLAQVKGATPATIVAVTEPKMNKFGIIEGIKTPNPYIGRTTKRVISNVFIGFIYKNSVNNALDKQGDGEKFTAKKRTWGTKIKGTCLVEHQGNWYLETRFLNDIKPKYFLDGKPTSEDTFIAFLPEKKSNAERQGLEEHNEVILRDYKLSAISEIKVGGEHYIVK